MIDQFKNAVLRFNKTILSELKESGINCWIAGGSLRDYFLGNIIKTDYDLFFPNLNEYKKAQSFFKTKKAKVKYESNNGMKVIYNNKTFDLVKIFFANPKETIDNFDFTVSMIAIDNEDVHYGETTFIDLAKKQLMINKITYPASTLKRAFRYYSKGFSICLSEMKKLIEAIQKMPKKVKTEKKLIKNFNDEADLSGNDFFKGID